MSVLWTKWLTHMYDEGSVAEFLDPTSSLCSLGRSKNFATEHLIVHVCVWQKTAYKVLAGLQMRPA